MLSCLVTAMLPAVASGALRAPKLSAPKAGERVESISSFTWRPVKGAALYEYQLAADRSFGSIVLGSGPGKGTARTRNTAATLSATVADGQYYWRVRAIESKDRAGRWSTARPLRKDWTTAPQLAAPADDTLVSWPSAPLVLRWTSVPHATRYIVSIATDDSMSNLVVGTSTNPLTTQGTSYALPGALSPGQRYFWAITAIDIAGHRGQRSRVGSFT